MGQSQNKTKIDRVEYDERSENGLVFGEQYLPEELVLNILCYVDYKTLLNCQLVCKRWKILIESYVWRKKAEVSLGRHLSWNKNTPWTLYYLMCKMPLFDSKMGKRCTCALRRKVKLLRGWSSMEGGEFSFRSASASG